MKANSAFNENSQIRSNPRNLLRKRYFHGSMQEKFGLYLKMLSFDNYLHIYFKLIFVILLYMKKTKFLSFISIIMFTIQ